MTKTKELRKIVKSLLDKTTGQTYYQDAVDDAAYPYKVFWFDMRVRTSKRDDLTLIIDTWGLSTSEVEGIADDIETILDDTNSPDGNSYPTFYLEPRSTIPDENKDIKRERIRVLVHNYYVGG